MSEAENVNFTNLKNEAIAFRDDALGKLETSALGATVGFLSSLTSTLSSFREMVSNPLDTLSTSLQGQLRDLTNLDIDLAAGIADPIAAARNIAQSSNLLESIKTDFGQRIQNKQKSLYCTTNDPVYEGMTSLAAAMACFLIDDGRFVP